MSGRCYRADEGILKTEGRLLNMKRDDWYKLQLITAWSVVGVVMLDYALFYLSTYLAATANEPPGLACLFSLILWYIFVFLLLISVVALCVMLIGREFGKKRLVIGIISLAVAVIVCVVNSPLLKVRPAGAEIFLRGFEKWVERNVDTDAIQEWIITAPEGYWADPCDIDWRFYGAEEELPKGLPQCFAEFKRQYVIFQRSELDGSRIIRFEWGGAMGHWGMVVGNPEMKMPSERKVEISEGFVRFQKPVKAGVYIYDEG